MATDALLQLLARNGVAMNQATFVASSREYVSAWHLSEQWARGPRADSELIGIIACELWRRWAPDPLSLEMIDERMQDGYLALERAGRKAGCEIWLGVWDALLGALEEERSIEELDNYFAGLTTVSNWVGDISTEVCNLALGDREFALRARDVYRRVTTRLPDSRLRQDLADLTRFCGDQKEAERILLALLDEEPDDAGSYARLATAITSPLDGSQPNIPRAIALLEWALARPVKEADYYDLAGRLADLRGQPA